MDNMYAELGSKEQDFEFVEHTLSVFKMDIDPMKWNSKNMTDWFYWVTHKHRFNLPKLDKTGFNLTNSDAYTKTKWLDHFGETAGQIMFDEFRLWLAYRDLKYMANQLSENEMKTEEDVKQQSKKTRETINSKPGRRNEKKDGKLYLWQTLLRLLLDEKYRHIISWTDYENGNFKILHPEEVSRVWGQSKGNPRMTYDKMSRSMRQYYKSKLLIKTNRDKLNYCFNMNDSAVKKFTNRIWQLMPVLKYPSLSELKPEA